MSWFSDTISHVQHTIPGWLRAAGGDLTGQEKARDWWSHYHLWSNHDARAAEAEQKALAHHEAKTTAGNIRNLRVTFGTFNDARPKFAVQNAASKENLAGRTANYEHYRQAYQSYFNPQLTDQFNTASHNDLFAGASTGTAGGSADQIRQGNTLNKYVAARAQIGARANQGVNDLKTADSQRELSLEDQIRHGGDASYLISQGLGNAQGAIANAQQNIGTDTLGDIFSNAGNLYEQGQVAQGYGRRGLQFGNPSTGGNATGSITG